MSETCAYCWRRMLTFVIYTNALIYLILLLLNVFADVYLIYFYIRDPFEVSADIL
jgi:hypothetical protein